MVMQVTDDEKNNAESDNPRLMLSILAKEASFIRDGQPQSPRRTKVRCSQHDLASVIGRRDPWLATPPKTAPSCGHRMPSKDPIPYAVICGVRLVAWDAIVFLFGVSSECS